MPPINFKGIQQQNIIDGLWYAFILQLDLSLVTSLGNKVE
jgi:hypothetical protein